MPHDMPYDIGENRRDPGEAISAPGSKKVYPGTTINDTLLPPLQGMVTGDEKLFLVKVRVTGTREPEDWDVIQKGNYVSIDFKEMSEPAKQAQT